MVDVGAAKSDKIIVREVVGDGDDEEGSGSRARVC